MIDAQLVVPNPAGMREEGLGFHGPAGPLPSPPVHADLLASLDVTRAVGTAYEDCEDRLDVVPRDPFLQTIAEM